MNKERKIIIENVLKLRVFILILLLLPMLSGCSFGRDKHEFTNYTGDSVKAFQRKTGLKLTEDSNHVYTKAGVVQLIAPDGKITSITLMKDAKNYSLFGLKIGMSKADAEEKLKDAFESETSKTINSSNNAVKYLYYKGDNEFYVSYDIETDLVVELSYYDLTNKDKKENSRNTVNAGELIAIIGKERVYYNEAMVYLKSAQDNYESEYGKDIWKADIFGDGKSFGDKMKEEVLKQITELKIIKEKAAEKQITLTEEEQAEAKAYAKEHFKGLSDADVDKYLITEELLEQVYADNLLAEKMFETETINVDTNVPDLDAKQITIQQILIYNTDFDPKGNKVPITEEQKQKAFEKVNNLLEQAKETEDFRALAEANTEADEVEYTFGRGQGPKEYSDAFEQAAFTLKTGEISDIITTDYGWHIIYCVTDFNKDATTQVKENIIDDRRTKMFSELYTEWSSDYDVIINREAWDSVSFDD